MQSFEFNSRKSSDKNVKKKNLKPLVITFGITAFLIFVLALLFSIYSSGFTRKENIKELDSEGLASFNALLDAEYPGKRTEILKNLPYKVNANLDVWAGSALLLDAANGNILYEKNADELIPPASITKLFVMYIVFEEIEAGRISLDDTVPLPEKSWAVNLPRDASLMFLGQGQSVTVRELLKGLAVASGNDAAIAIAVYVSGSTKAFVERMNAECEKLGLSKTHFVEPSGYDEHNVTTARELAAFCVHYVNKYPLGIEEFHSAVSIKYPLEHNLPSWEKDKGDSLAVYQRNTNPLLGLLDGCDGIKTGFIYESGYNLALTAKRNGTRFISVSLKGWGRGTRQGNEGRIHDGTEMMEWAFSNFADFSPEEKLKEGFPSGIVVPSIGAKNTSGKFVRLVPAWVNPITVQKKSSLTAVEAAQKIRINMQIPRFIYGGVEAGKTYGQIQYSFGDEVIETVPLVADRTQEKAGAFKRALDALVSWGL